MQLSRWWSDEMRRDDPTSDCCGLTKFKSIRETIQTDPELILDKAVTMARRTEAIRYQQAVVRGETDNACTRIEAGEHSYNTSTKATNYVPSQQDSKSANKKDCTRSSKFPTHPSAWFVKLHAISVKKQGHYQSVCRSVTNLTTIWTDTVNKESFLGTIEIISTHSKDNQWMVEILLIGKPVQFKIDTGADVTTISEEIF